jgi:hypothetical protein
MKHGISHRNEKERELGEGIFQIIHCYELCNRNMDDAVVGAWKRSLL